MKTRAKSQAGVVLVTSLIMLVMMTLLVVSLVRTSVIELKIGGASQIAAQRYGHHAGRTGTVGNPLENKMGE